MRPKAGIDLGPHLKSPGSNRPANKKKVQGPQVSKPKPPPVLPLDNMDDDIRLQARKTCTKIGGEYKICGNTTSQKKEGVKRKIQKR